MAGLNFGGQVSSSHRYVFQLHALNIKLKLKPEASRTDLGNAIKGHILATAELVGRYQTSQQTEEAAEGAPPAVRWGKSRLEVLGEDPDYLMKTQKLLMELKKAHSLSPTTVEKFFRTVSLSRRPAKVQKFLNKIDPDVDPKVRRILDDCVSYSNRYRVYFKLRTDPLEFELRAWPQDGVIFHAKVVRGCLQPPALHFIPGDDDSLVEYFRADDLELRPRLKKLVDDGKATFLRIDEKEGFSILRQMEDIAHKDDGFAIIEHNAEQPYFIIICGPKVNKKRLADLGTALTEFQLAHYVDSFGGRKPNMERMKRDSEADKKPISQKAKAIDAVGTDPKKLNAEQVRLARRKSKIRQTKL
jgi:hypothetical protein